MTISKCVAQVFVGAFVVGIEHGLSTNEIFVGNLLCQWEGILVR